MPPIDPITMSTNAAPQASKPSLPIEILSSDFAKIFTHAQPALLLSAYYFRFPALVENPTSALSISLLPLAVLQFLYTVICLPATGSSAKPVKRLKFNASKKGDGPSQRILTSIFALVLSTLSIPVLAIIQVLFGAPITTHIPHTLLSSAHLALLAIYPIVYVHGYDNKKWREILSVYSPIDEVFGGTVGCFLGAWLGAVPIPLDWDREWQKWPVTVVTGAYAGYAVGKIVGGWVLKGKRIEFD